MGWRETLADVARGAVFWCEAKEGRDLPTALGEDVLSDMMPPADRIALARELLAGTGRVVAKDVPVSNKFDNWWHGWNAARAAMLGDER